MEWFGYLLLFLITIIWVMYLYEAFRQNLFQGILTLLLPFYVFYFAFIRSIRSSATGILLSALVSLYLTLPLLSRFF